MSTCIVYLASPRDWRHLSWSRLDCLEASIELARRFAPGIPVIVFNEDMTADDKYRMEAAARVNAMRFVDVDFTGDEDRFVSQRPGERVGTYGYAKMCEFFCGPMQAHPALQGFTHYIRLDDDSYLMGPLDVEEVEKHDYTYAGCFEDPHQGLYDYTMGWMGYHVTRKVIAPYTGASPYTNFHGASLSMWRHPMVRDYLKDVSDWNGFLGEGWNDANVQRMLIDHVMPAAGLSVHVTEKLDYRHNQHCHHPRRGHGKLCLDGVHPKDQHQWGPPKL